MHFIRHHKCRIEAQSEVADHVILRRLVLIFLQELCCAGKCDLGNILLHLVSGHTKTIIDKLQRLFLRVDLHLDRRLIVVRKLVLTHHIQLFQLGDRVASIGNHLTDENIMIRINPFLYNWKNVFTAN